MLDATTAEELIKPHMPVVCSENVQFATVERVAAPDEIKLTRDKNGVYHYIPLEWVVSVDDKVHIDRPGAQAMEAWTTSAKETP